MNAANDKNQFSFFMELGEYGQVASKQRFISSLKSGTILTVQFIQTGNFGFFELLADGKKIGLIPPEHTEKFFKSNGTLREFRCTVIGLIPCKQRTVTCEVCAEFFKSEKQKKLADEQLDVFPCFDLDSLPPKRVRKFVRHKGEPPVYIGESSPVRRMFYKNEFIILLSCFLLPPVGLVLLFLFSRRKIFQKAAICSASFCFCLSFFAIFYITSISKNDISIPTSNTPERVAMLFAENWQNENWDILLYLSAPQTSLTLEEVEEKFGADKINGFQFTQIYKSDKRVTYELETYIPNEKKNKKAQTEEVPEYETRTYTFDVIRTGTAWYSDLSSFNYEMSGASLETLFASDSHIVIEQEEAEIVYLDPTTLTYHYRIRCAPDGAPENILSEALAKGYGPCYRCAR